MAFHFPVGKLWNSFYPTAHKDCRCIFSPMVSGWAVGRAGRQAAGKSLPGLYLRNRKV